MQNRSRCGFVVAALRRHGIIPPKAAVYTAARVQGTRPCADAQGFGNIEPRKTAAGAVLLWPFHGVMV